MKKTVLLLYICLIGFVSFAQTNKPLWVTTGTTPKPENDTYLYKIGIGMGETKSLAKNNALVDILVKAASQVVGITSSVKINTEDVLNSLQNGMSFEAICDEYTIPINIISEYSEKSGNEFNYYLLGQVPKSTLKGWSFDEGKGSHKIDHSEDWKAFRMSFLPGLGHIYKNHKALGYTIMVSDIALVCGGIGCYFAAQTYSDIMDDPTATASEKRDAESTYNMLNSASIVCYSAAAVLYIVNLWTAYTISDNRNTRVSFHPVISPNNKDIALGIGASFKF